MSIIQAAHAAAKIGDKFHGETSIVLCGANNEEHLYDISEFLGSHDIDHTLFFEPDISGHTAIATRPLTGKDRNPMKKFSLLQ